MPGNCYGGFDSGNDLCLEGNIGALCEECDVYGIKWGTGYSIAEKYKCGKCDDSEKNTYIIIAMSIWTVISIMLSIKGTKEKLENKILIRMFQ